MTKPNLAASIWLHNAEAYIALVEACEAAQEFFGTITPQDVVGKPRHRLFERAVAAVEHGLAKAEGKVNA